MSFDVEKAIGQWRIQLQSQSGLEPGDIEELEIHLRDVLDDTIDDAVDKEKAFNDIIEKRFGDLDLISDEYQRSRINLFSNNLNPLNMLPINLKNTLRHFMRNKSDALINTLGLVISISAGILIFQYIVFESSYDQFFTNHESIHRVSHQAYNTSNGNLRGKYATTFYAVADEIKDEVPEIEASTRLLQLQGILTKDETQFRENDIFFSRSDFFDVFDLNLLRGNKKDLDDPNIIFISESTAKKYFGINEAFGQSIEVALIGGPTDNYEVRGIYKDIPENSHLKVDALISHANFVSNIVENRIFGDRSLDDVRWRLVGHHQYIKLKPNVDLSRLQPKLDKFMAKNRGEIDKARNVLNQFYLQNIADIHLSEKINNEIKPKGDENIILFLKIIFLTILILGWVNYINLTTAKSINRAKEVGVRKVIGSTRKQLISKFIIESFTLNLIAIILAIGVVIIAIPYFHQIIEKPIFTYIEQTWKYWPIFGAVLLIGVLFSSIYPATILSAFKPVAIIKGKFKNSKNGILIRRGLVTFQFSVSLILLIAIYVLFNQINFMRNHELGFEMDQTLVLRGPSVNDSTTNRKLNTFRDILNNETNVLSATVSNSVPGSEIRNRTAGRHIRGSYQGEDIYLNRIIAYDNYVDFYDFKLLAGRTPSFSRPADELSIMLNRRATELFGFETPEEAINQKIAYVLSDTVTIVGVVEDFAQRGLQVAYEPISIELSNNRFGSFVSLKINAANISKKLAFIESEYHRFFPRDPFEYFFLDEHFNRQYQSEEKYSTILSLFTFIAIAIAVLGLLGLTSYMVRLRMKEVAVRKVLGASVKQIFRVLTKEYFYLIGAAGLIALPIAYYTMNSWLDTFAFKAPMDLKLFVVPVIVLIAITLVTIGRISILAALSNPVKSLKDE